MRKKRGTGRQSRIDPHLQLSWEVYRFEFSGAPALVPATIIRSAVAGARQERCERLPVHDQVRNDAAGAPWRGSRVLRAIDRTDGLDNSRVTVAALERSAMAGSVEGTMRNRGELKEMLQDVARRLSPAHVAALVAHPKAVRSALAAAADALAADEREHRSSKETIAAPALPAVDPAEAQRRISARTREVTPETLLTTEKLAARMGLKTRQSVHDWRRKGRIVGWQNARRGYVLPAEQLDGRNRPLPGLDLVAGRFADGYAAWVWLTTPRPSLDGATPLALLGRGEVEHVAEAARGDRQGDFA